MAPANSIEQQVMVYLIQCAIERRTTTYTEVAERFNLPTEWPQLGQVVGNILYRIFDWCEAKRLPKLTVLVVRKSGADMALPGQGFWTVADLPHISRREKVLLTEMWTTDVYAYYTVPLEGERNRTGGGDLILGDAYEACLKIWKSLGNYNDQATNKQLMQRFDNAARAAYGPDVIRIQFYNPREITFEYNTGDEWVRLRLDANTLARIQNGD